MERAWHKEGLGKGQRNMVPTPQTCLCPAPCQDARHQSHGVLPEGNPAPALKAAQQKMEVVHSQLVFRTLRQMKIPAWLKQKKFTRQNTEKLPNEVVPEATMEWYSIHPTVQHLSCIHRKPGTLGAIIAGPCCCKRQLPQLVDALQSLSAALWQGKPHPLCGLQQTKSKFMRLLREALFC